MQRQKSPPLTYLLRKLQLKRGRRLAASHPWGWRNRLCGCVRHRTDVWSSSALSGLPLLARLCWHDTQKINLGQSIRFYL